MGKKLLSFFTAIAVVATMLPTAFAGGSAAQISIASGNPSGYVAPGSESVVMKFKMEATFDILVRNLRVDVSGSGVNYVGTLSLKDESGRVLDSINAVSEHNFSPWYRLDAGDNQVFTVVANIPESASEVKNLDFDVSIGSVDVIDPNGAGSYSTNPSTLQGSNFNFGGLFSADTDFSNFQAVASNRYVTRGEGVVLSSFWISYKNPLRLQSMTVKINGNGQAGVERVYLRNANQTVITSGLLNSSGEVTFVPGIDIATAGTKFEIYALTEEDAVPGTTISSVVTAANLITSVGSKMWLGNDLPYSDNTFTIRSGDALPDETGSVLIDAGDFEEPIEDEDQDENPFSDISSSKAQSLEGKAALYLSARNIIRGYLVSADPVKIEFRGTNQLNRAEAVKFIVNSLELDDSEYCQNAVFPDVPVGEWYTKYVCTARKLGIISGNPDGTFDPGRTVNKAEFVKMLTEAHGLTQAYSSYGDVVKTDWYAKYAGTVQTMGLFPSHGDKFLATKVLNRWETAVAVYLVMSANN